MGVYKRGGVWWYRFKWNNQEVRESTKQGNKRLAEQMEAARKTLLAKKEAGIRVGAVPTLREFLEKRFLPWVRTTAAKPATLTSYELQVRILLAFKAWADTPIDSLSIEQLQTFIGRRQSEGKQVSTINRSLAALRRALSLAEEWEVIYKKPMRVRLLEGENQRERVLTEAEEAAYLKAALELSHEVMQRYWDAVAAHEAGTRKLKPTRPDARLMHDAAVILLDCGLRPDELYRLQWEQIANDEIRILTGKGSGSRRAVPLTQRASAILEARRAESTSVWVFPAETATGHTNQGSVHQLHERVIAESGIAHFPLYVFRHTALTRLASLVVAFDLQKFAGHRSLSTTTKYVHLNDAAHSERMRAAQSEVQGRHKIRHSPKTQDLLPPENVM